MGTELKDCVSGICMKEEMRKAVIENVKERTGNTAGEYNSTAGDNSRGRDDNRRKRHMGGWKRSAAAAAIFVVLAGAAAIPVRALVDSFVRERMEKMPQEEKDHYAETLLEQKGEADGLSRAYTPKEERRYREMGRKYQEGIFPEEEIVKVGSEKEAEAYEFCYLTSTGTFCLPERELTDEELLQIIDFTVKREYAYTEYYEREQADEIAAGKAQEQEKIMANTEGGGITKQQAEEIAAQKLLAVYGVNGDGFEKNAYYDDEIYGGSALYCVNWTNIITHQYYYFYIDAKDGHMIWACRSGADLSEAPLAGAERIAEQIPVLEKKAQEFMETEMQESFEEVYVSYLLYQDGKAEKQVSFYLTGKDGSAYEITYLWDGTLTEICEKKDISGKEDGKTVRLWDGERYIETTEVFRKLTG